MGGDATKLPASVRPIRRRPTIADPRRTDIAWLAALAAVLLVWFVGPFVVFGYAFPVGPDGPVYLWWTRFAGAEGLSVVERPGVPALTLTLSGALGLPVTATLAGLECVLGVAVGTAAAALVRPSGAPRIAWPLAGLLAGTFAVHLTAGYLANLMLAAAFLAAAVLLTTATRAGAIGAAVVLGAGGLAHPLFLVLAITILVATAALRWHRDRSGSLRVVSCAAGAGAIGGFAWLWLQFGLPPLDVDTSRDAFLRRVGLTDILRSAYRDRLFDRWARYVQWASLPLAALGIPVATSFVGSFLAAWVGVTIVGVVVGAITGAFPPDRFITFGFAIPIAAALGIVRLPTLLRGRRMVALALGAGLAVAMLAGAFVAWARQEPFISRHEVRQVEATAIYGLASPPEVALVFPVNDDDGELSFEATRLNNVVRAALPPSLIRRAFVVVAEPPDDAGAERRALAGPLAPGDERILVRPSVTALLRSFDPVDPPPAGADEPASGVFVSAPAMLPPRREIDRDPLQPASAPEIALAAVAALGVMWLAGYGPARAILRDIVAALAVAPAVGATSLMLVAFVLERLGLALEGRAGPLLVSVVAVAGGLAVGLVRQRRAVAETPA